MAKREIINPKDEDRLVRKRKDPMQVVALRMKRKMILQVEHYSIDKEMDIPTAYRDLIQAGLDKANVEQDLERIKFYPNRVKWVDPTGDLGFNEEPDDETMSERAARQERELEESLKAREAELIFKAFGEPREATYCAHCAATNELKFTWYAADKPPWGNCQGCGEPSYVSDYLARYHPNEETANES